MALGFGKYSIIILYWFCIKIFIHFYSCKSNNERTKGCQEVSTSVDHIQTSSVDVDRELSRIHALCVTHIDRFDNVLSKNDNYCNIYYTLFMYQ